MNYNYASFGQRAIAYIIDYIIVTFISIPFYFLLNNPTLSFNDATLLPRTVIFLIYNVYMISHQGRTIGKKIMGIRVMGENGSLLSVNQALLREFLGKMILGIFIIGYFWMFIDKEKQCWQDKMAGSVVIEG
jgi:uncharacterized RDD family membrane protein YckC